MLAVALTLAGSLLAQQPSILIRGGLVYDGSGRPAVRTDIRVRGTSIVAVGKLTRSPGEQVLDVSGLIVAPGFIDSHSHADVGIKQHPSAESQVRQGITTAVVGQDGSWSAPVSDQMRAIEEIQPSVNFAFFSGHGGIRRHVLEDPKAPATQQDTEQMKALVKADMDAGALGLSTGLEYDPGHYASTEEIVKLAKVVAPYRGMYISHVRDETAKIFESIEEVIRIAREAKVPAQVSHIKMGVSQVWGQSDKALRMILDARRAGVDITADVYPYLYWQSTITVLTTSRDWKNPYVWEAALADVGGPENVRLTRYSPNASWERKTLRDLEVKTGKEAPALIMEIIARTADGKGEESIVCTAMTEKDLKRFIAAPIVMFCSDGLIGGSHPRGAGSFPRVLGRYVRELRVLSMAEAIRKMTSYPATRFRMSKRGLLRPGYAADIVVFDPGAIRDTATPENPTAFAQGIKHVFVNGKAVLTNEKMSGARPGQIVKRAGN